MMKAQTRHADGRLDGQLVTLFGGGGFLGRHAAQALMQAGARVRIVGRHPERDSAIRALGDLGQVQLVGADITRPGHAARAMVGSDAVVNLVGSFADMMAVQGDGAGNIAQAAAATGVRTLLHISAIGADPASPSLYGRSKAAGEAAVRAAFPAATILRPSIVFGRQDQFINRFAGLIRALSVLPVVHMVPVVAPDTRFQPVFVADVAQAIVAAVARGEAAAGRCFELGGPQKLSMRELFTWIARNIGRSPVFIEVPDVVAGAMATLTGWLPGAPITRDQWAMLGRDNIVADGAASLADLGIVATPMDAVTQGWLEIYRPHGRFSGKFAA